MRRRRVLLMFLCSVLLAAASAAAQSPSRPGYDVAFIGPPLADAVMQHNKETYVMFGCAYCHGVNLVPRGEATDLRQSAVVGGDVDAESIGRVLRAGIPQTAKLSPMPQFSDLSDQQIRAIAAWIHYARGQARAQALTATAGTAGTPSAGKTSFDQRCASCHAPDRDLAKIGGKYDAARLRAQILEPRSLTGPQSFSVDRRQDTKATAGRRAHQALLENSAEPDVANLVAYLQTIK